jgi:hypothetical protein
MGNAVAGREEPTLDRKMESQASYQTNTDNKFPCSLRYNQANTYSIFRVQ